MMLGLMMVWISVPVQAQNVIEDEGIETVDETKPLASIAA